MHLIQFYSFIAMQVPDRLSSAGLLEFDISLLLSLSSDAEQQFIESALHSKTLSSKEPDQF